MAEIVYNIRVNYDPKPIPDRRFDWEAVRTDYEPGEPIGWGKTPTEAVADLIEEEEFEAS